MLVIGDWLLVIGYWLLVIGCWLLVIGYQVPSTKCQAPMNMLNHLPIKYHRLHLIASIGIRHEFV
ncbi:MAG: hypothetical protein WCO02_04590 [Bacteroidota bacterium]